MGHDHEGKEDRSSQWVSKDVQQLGMSSTLRMNQLQSECAAENDLAPLGFGRSPFPPPTCLVEAIRAHADYKEYAPVAGITPLRSAIAAQHTERYKNAYTADNVVVTPGSKLALYLLLRALQPSIRVYVLAPCWVSYVPQCQLTGHSVGVPTYN